MLSFYDAQLAKWKKELYAVLTIFSASWSERERDRTHDTNSGSESIKKEYTCEPIHIQLLRNVKGETFTEYEKNYTHTVHKCYICNMNPIRNIRWECQDCADINLCTDCAVAQLEAEDPLHPSDHMMSVHRPPKMSSHNGYDVDYMPHKFNKEKVDRLHRLREAVVNWQVVSERNDFLVDLQPIINGWHNQLPNLLDIFRPEEIELLLLDCMNNSSPSDEEVYLAELFVEFVARSGYQDSFYAVDEKNEPTSRRTTPLHLAARCTFYNRDTMIPLLFKIYNRFDVNYIDEESGYTHFHVACEYGCIDVVKNFLKCGQDPDCIVAGTNETLLHLAAKNSSNKKVIAMLLNKGADSRRPNNEGTTIMHLVCRYDDEEVLQMVYESDQRQLVEAIDVEDNFGWTPLHTALFYDNVNVAKWLLQKGADSNSTNGDEETPLHVICKRRNDNSGAVKVLFETCDDVGQVVQLDVKNNQRLTPLQEAVANLKPNTVAVLLNRGADLSSFVFPTQDHFTKSFRVRRHEYDFKLELAAGLLCVVEQLEQRGYRLSRSNALVIMQLFAQNGLLIDESADLEGRKQNLQ
ncbi:unnamed protein product [Trichogramma brassicae]|uniref:ZZ-type domain-containing protein n=1 Tax=Trichogramma brassicae TaxID=86971 RepID=A0A6H5IHT1_9HYME|nr:unnamed protein product [Trichogramma brassicae]